MKILVLAVMILMPAGIFTPASISMAAKNASSVDTAKGNLSFCKKVNALEEKLLSNSKQIWASPDMDNDFQLCRLIVETKGDYQDFDACGGAVIHGPDSMSVIQYRTVAETKAAYEILKKDKQLLYVEPDKIIRATDTVADGGCDAQNSEQAADDTGVYMTRAERLFEETVICMAEQKANGVSSATGFYSWGVEKTHCDVFADYLKEKNKNKKIYVAVVDSGIASDHPLLKKRVATKKGKDFVDGDNDPYDQNDHGTHVAGTIVDCTKGCKNIKVFGVRVLNANGSGSTFTVAQGILYAGKKKADVINMSLGGDEDRTIDSAVNKVSKKGTVVVVAAGNETQNTSRVCPAHIKNCITVSAVDSDLRRAYFSNYGSAVDIAAPGVSIKSSVPGGGYAWMDGTSMATPHVAAMIAMIKVLHPSYSQTRIHKELKKIATDLGSSGRDNYYGYGFPDMRKAIPKYKIKPTKITFTNSEVSVQLSHKKQLEVVIKPNNATETELTWSSSNPEIVSVSKNGVIKGLALGTATITAKTVNGKKAKCVVTVKKQAVYPTSIQIIGEEDLTLEVGEVYSYSAKLLPDNVTETTVKWTSSDSSVATVDSNGTVTAVGEGYTLITAKTVNGLRESVFVMVNPLNIEAESVELNVTSLNLVTGETYQLVETVLPEETTNKLVTWESEDVDVARVSFQGVVTAESNGTTVITVRTANGKTASCTVTVTGDPEVVVFNSAEYTVGVNEKIALDYMIFPSDASTNSFQWYISPSYVARIDERGNVTGVSAGEATVTLYYGNGQKTRTKIIVLDEGGSGTLPVSDSGEIYTAEELMNISMTGNYTLMNDIDLSGIRWIPLGTSAYPFSGVFDGNGYQITGMNIGTDAVTTGSDFGLFGVVTGTVKNLSVSGSCMISGDLTGSSAKQYTYGGIAGVVDSGLIENCQCNITGSAHFTSAGFGSVRANIGGVCGILRGSGRISRSSHEGSFGSVLEAKYEGSICSGGIVGYLYSTATVAECTNMGMISGYGLGEGQNGIVIHSGGLVGYGQNGTYISDCMNMGIASAECRPTYAGNVTKKSYAYAGGFCGYSPSILFINCNNSGTATADGNDYVNVKQANDTPGNS